MTWVWIWSLWELVCDECELLKKMFYVFVKIYNCGCNKCMIWVWLGIFENVKWWMRIVVKCIGILESDGYGNKNIFYIVLNWKGLLWESVTLCLPIPLAPVMYPWVWVVTKLVSEHWLNSCIFSWGICFPYCCGD